MGKMMGSIFSYLKLLTEELLRIVATAVAASALYMILMYGGRFIWEVFIGTYTGTKFLKLKPELAEQILEVFAIEPYWQTALELAGVSALFLLAVGLISQFIYLRHLLYSPIPWPFRLVIWSVGLSFALAWLLMEYDASLSSYYSYVVLLIPGMASLLFPVMKSAQRIIPDIGALIVNITSRFT